MKLSSTSNLKHACIHLTIEAKAFLNAETMNNIETRAVKYTNMAGIYLIVHIFEPKVL